MIKKYKLFESIPNMDYLIGLPSGQIIDIHYTQINNLKQEGLLRYDDKLNSYTFKDVNYDLILRKLGKNKVKLNTEDTESDLIYSFFDTQKSVRGFKVTSEGVEVSGSVYISNLKEFKEIPFKFKNISGDFIWKDCKLDSLKNSPIEVGKSFIVNNNNLFNLVGGPTYVGENYDCSSCLINSLKGSPKKILGDFDCSDNFLRDLKDGPTIVKGTFDCSKNYLVSLVGLPDCLNIVGGQNKKIKKYR